MEDNNDYMGEEIFDIFCKNDTCIDEIDACGSVSIPGITNENTCVNDNEYQLPIIEDVEEKTSFLGSSITESRNRCASELESELAYKHIHISGSYKFDETHGGFDWSTGQKIHDAIDKARGEEKISDYTYKKLIDKLDDACYYQ